MSTFIRIERLDPDEARPKLIAESDLDPTYGPFDYFRILVRDKLISQPGTYLMYKVADGSIPTGMRVYRFCGYLHNNMPMFTTGIGNSEPLPNLTTWPPKKGRKYASV